MFHYHEIKNEQSHWNTFEVRNNRMGELKLILAPSIEETRIRGEDESLVLGHLDRGQDLIFFWNLVVVVNLWSSILNLERRWENGEKSHLSADGRKRVSQHKPVPAERRVRVAEEKQARHRQHHGEAFKWNDHHKKRK